MSRFVLFFRVITASIDVVLCINAAKNTFHKGKRVFCPFVGHGTERLVEGKVESSYLLRTTQHLDQTEAVQQCQEVSKFILMREIASQGTHGRDVWPRHTRDRRLYLPNPSPMHSSYAISFTNLSAYTMAELPSLRELTPMSRIQNLFPPVKLKLHSILRPSQQLQPNTFTKCPSK